MPHRITIANSETPLSFTARGDQSVLDAMAQGGASGIAIGCRSGGCGVCRVQVVSGEYRTGTMSGAQISEQDLACGNVLACQLFPDSDLALARIPRTSWTQHLFPGGVPAHSTSLSS